jgi:hypothetical protein
MAARDEGSNKKCTRKVGKRAQSALDGPCNFLPTLPWLPCKKTSKRKIASKIIHNLFLRRGVTLYRRHQLLSGYFSSCLFTLRGMPARHFTQAPTTDMAATACAACSPGAAGTRDITRTRGRNRTHRGDSCELDAARMNVCRSALVCV